MIQQRLPWVEKYRPKSVTEISHQEQVVNTLQTAISSGNIPHLLFYGPPGTGKTSTAVALSKQLFGQYCKERTLELNASDERGISVVRDKIKKFAGTAVAKRKENGHEIPNFKLIILDEADSMTQDAQSALRRTMEIYTNVTRFCLICNYVSRIIEPIASRCAKFRFQPLPSASMKARLEEICAKEEVKYDVTALNALLDTSEGDMRKALTLLQSASDFNNKIVDEAIVSEISGRIPVESISKILPTIKGSSFPAVQELATELTFQGFGVDMLCEQVLQVVYNDEMTENEKAEICLVLGETDMKLVQGADSELQLLGILASLYQIFHS